MAKKKKQERKNDPAKVAGGQSDDAAVVREHIGDQFARITAPRQLNDPAKRMKWKLPESVEDRGPYIIELNLQHIGGLPGAISEFRRLIKDAVTEVNPEASAPEPVRISKTYYRCELSVLEWRKLLEQDDQLAFNRVDSSKGEKPDQYRAIFRLWPDFPVTSQTYRSIPTIKGDAAIRSFDATGRGIVWAVIDSGIQAEHPHFGATFDDPNHTLGGMEVRDLHRCFVAVPTEDGANDRMLLEDPDAEFGVGVSTPHGVSADADLRSRLVDQHRRAALNDEFGHGTHVAGIIAGRAPDQLATVRAYEREFKVDPTSQQVESQFNMRNLNESSRACGVAPRCRLVSLRVLDENGDGRSSDVIRALEYIREKINDDTRFMRVHGVNLSVGYEYDPEMFACGQSPLCAAVNRLVQSGVVVVAAAGNTGYGTVAADIRGTRVGLSNTINDPGNAASAITVGSTHPERPYTYGVSYFSSKGPTGDGRLKPDLVAPGERILSCAAGRKLAEAKSRAVEVNRVNGDALDGEADSTAANPADLNSAETASDANGKSPDLGAAATPLAASATEAAAGSIPGVKADYIEDSGTSMAAPHVSGAVAAFLSIRREFIGKPQEVKRIFLENASSLGRERYFEGHGLLDLMRAIQSV